MPSGCAELEKLHVELNSDRVLDIFTVQLDSLQTMKRWAVSESRVGYE